MRRAVLLVLLVLAGCAGGTAQPQSFTERQTIAACRQQANTAFNVQNRDQIYQIHEPFAYQSSTGLTGDPTQGLSDSFQLQQMIQNCVRNTGTNADRTVGSYPALGPSPVAPGPSLGR
jgi:hypothetical protein